MQIPQQNRVEQFKQIDVSQVRILPEIGKLNPQYNTIQEPILHQTSQTGIRVVTELSGRKVG